MTLFGTIIKKSMLLISILIILLSVSGCIRFVEQPPREEPGFVGFIEMVDLGYFETEEDGKYGILEKKIDSFEKKNPGVYIRLWKNYDNQDIVYDIMPLKSTTKPTSIYDVYIIADTTEGDKKMLCEAFLETLSSLIEVE